MRCLSVSKALKCASIRKVLRCLATLIAITILLEHRANGLDIKDSFGQMIIAGFFGTSASDPNFDRVIYDLEHNLVGGVLFLARNITSRSELTAMIERVRTCNCPATPFIAIDEEGGAIERLGGKFDYRHTPSPATIAVLGEATAKLEYAKLARRLSDMGFNLNLAPVVDLNSNPSNPIIGALGRSFSSDPKTVARYAAYFIKEHRRLRILTSLKHFPGHGSSEQDTHSAVADVSVTWRSDELSPFDDLIKGGLADSILVGHLANSKVWEGTATQAPSTAISKLLREKLKFDGVIISDDLGMDAVRAGSAPFSDVIVSAVRAGIDVLIVGRLPDQDQAADPGAYAYAAVANAIAAGEIDTKQLKRSLDRIAKLKRRLSRANTPTPSRSSLSVKKQPPLPQDQRRN